ncbi:MAG: thymidine phosphorylase [Coriobacteriia bacterium]|nr:thymidine phosphorylase [Coriobacteriia bacterium]
MPTIEELIARKRDGGGLSAEELDRLVLGFTAGEVPDYQMAAWLMAACIRGLDAEETVWLTDAMVRSGERVDLSALGRTVLDKHSTGGVGDTVTLVVAPLVAACGGTVAKVSGHGLGHTGGTLDKLESIPGFRTALSIGEFVRQADEVGVAVIAQSPEVDPADGAMYALRDVTATVPSIPLIVASIVSKKVAGGADAVLIDVKSGSGAFAKTGDEARALARQLTRVGAALGRCIRCVVSDMDEPLGAAVGNALEVAEAVATMRSATGRLAEVCVAIAGRMLAMGGGAPTAAAGEALAREALADGRALEAFRRWVRAQGGDEAVAEDPADVLPRARERRVTGAPRSGYLSRMDAEGVGRAAAALGAGRTTKDAAVDPGAGIVLHARVGEPVSRDDPLATLHAAGPALLDEGERRLLAAVGVTDDRPEPRALLTDV